MTENKSTGNPFFDAWMTGQQWLTHNPMAEGFAGLMGTASPGAGLPDVLARAQDNWKLCEKQARDWVAGAWHWLGAAAEDGPEGITEETLHRMFDPNRFLYSGSDEVGQMIERLVEGPEFADIGMLERQALKATKEWLALREASAAYRMITAQAWGRAFETFSKEIASKPPTLKDSARSVLNRWLATVNDEMIRTQRTDRYLEAQRRLLRAGVDYRLKERELVEVWCETHSIPTRTEIDDLHRTVHELRRQVRELKRELAVAGRAAPRRKTAAKRN